MAVKAATKKNQEKAWGNGAEERVSDMAALLVQRQCHQVGRPAAVFLQSYDRLQLWMKRNRAFYVLYSRETGNWDILVPSDNGGNTPEAALAGLDKYLE